MYTPSKRAIKNLERLVKSFNLTASRVNKRYVNVENYVPVPTYSVKDILSHVHTYSDLRRERAKLNRFFKKNKPDSQDLVIDKQTSKTVTKWFKRESEYMMKRERKRIYNIEKGLEQNKKIKEESYKDIRDILPDYPRNSQKPDSEKSFKGLEDRLADMTLPNVAHLYLEEMRNNGYMFYDEGKQVEKIIMSIFKEFPYYLETCFYTGDERSTIEYLYISHEDYTTRNVLHKVHDVYIYWLECAANIAL